MPDSLPVGTLYSYSNAGLPWRKIIFPSRNFAVLVWAVWKTKTFLAALIWKLMASLEIGMYLILAVVPDVFAKYNGRKN